MSASGSSDLKLEDIPVMNVGRFILDKMKEHDPEFIALVGKSYLIFDLRIASIISNRVM